MEPVLKELDGVLEDKKLVDERIVDLAKPSGMTKGRRMRVGTTVVEAPISQITITTASWRPMKSASALSGTSGRSTA